MRDIADSETGFDMQDKAKKRIRLCLEAYRRTINPQFRSFWYRNAKHIAKKNGLNLKELFDA
jgi:hypothetical protein